MVGVTSNNIIDDRGYCGVVADLFGGCLLLWPIGLEVIQKAT